VRRCLTEADMVVSSDLTLVECERALIRASFSREISATRGAGLRSRLAAASNRWNVLNLTPEIMDRARQPFPAEPIRTLDALHVPRGLGVRSELREFAVRSVDARIRKVSRALGLDVLPGWGDAPDVSGTAVLI